MKNSKMGTWLGGDTVIVGNRVVRSASPKNCRVTLPIDLCENMNISEGDELVFKRNTAFSNHFMVGIRRKSDEGESKT